MVCGCYFGGGGGDDYYDFRALTLSSLKLEYSIQDYNERQCTPRCSHTNMRR